jgi:hypothetical protein
MCLVHGSAAHGQIMDCTLHRGSRRRCRGVMHQPRVDRITNWNHHEHNMYDVQKENAAKSLAWVLKLRGSPMTELKIGYDVGLPCEVKLGPFEDERLVSFETVDGPVTGFVSTDELQQIDEDRWMIHAVVVKIERDVVTVKVRGSFFTTNGLAHIRPEMALAA